MEGNEEDSIVTHEQQQALAEEALRKFLTNPFVQYEEENQSEFCRLVNLIDSQNVKQLILRDHGTLNNISIINRKYGLPKSLLDTLISILLQVPFLSPQYQQQQPVSSNEKNSICISNGESQTNSKLLLQIARSLKHSVFKDVNSISLSQFLKLLQSCSTESLAQGNELTKLILNEVALAISAYVNTADAAHQVQVQCDTSIFNIEEFRSCLRERIAFMSAKVRSNIESAVLTTENVITKDFQGNLEVGGIESRYSQNFSETPNVTIGTEILRNIQSSAGTSSARRGLSRPQKFQAHAVMTQEAVACSNSEFESEKNKIEQICLVNTLNRSAFQNASSLKGQDKNLKSLTSKADTPISWFGSSGYYIRQFLDNVKGNREKHDRDKVILSDKDIEWLRSVFSIDASKFDWLDSKFGMTRNIAEIFSIISEHQKIPTEPQDVVLHLAEEIFTKNLPQQELAWYQGWFSESFGHSSEFDPWENCRMYILTTVDYHSIRNEGNLSDALLAILEEFHSKPECTQKMEAMILCIKSRSLRVRQDISQLCQTFLSMCKMILQGPTNLDRDSAISFVGQYIIQKKQFQLIFDHCTSSEKRFYEYFFYLIVDFKFQFDLRIKVATILEMYLVHSFTEALDWSHVLKLSDILLMVSPEIQVEGPKNDGNHADPEEVFEKKLKSEELHGATIIRLFFDSTRIIKKAKDRAKKFILRPSEAKTSRRNFVDTQSQIVQFKSSLVRSILHCMDKKPVEAQVGRNINYCRILSTLVECSTGSGNDNTNNLQALNHITIDLQVLIVAALESWLSRNPGVPLEKSASLAPKLCEKHRIYSDGNVVLHEGTTSFETETDFTIPSEADDESESDGHDRDTTSTFVSAIVGRLLLGQLKSVKSVSVFYYVLPYALESLKSHPDKTTRILCAEYIFESFVQSGKNGHVLSLSKEALGLLRNLARDDQVIDVKIYCTSSYCLGLNNIVCLIAENEVVNIHQRLAHSKPQKSSPAFSFESYEVDALAYMYVWDDLVLEEREFKSFINPPILNILQSLAQASNTQVQFSDDIFSMLHLILQNESSSNSESPEIIVQVLRVFHEYTNFPPREGSNSKLRKSTLPNNCREAVDNVYFLDDPSILQLCEQIFINLQTTGHTLSDVCLNQILKNLVNLNAKSDQDNFSRYGSILQIIFLANQNQDVSDSVFNRLDMELAGCTVLAYFELTEFKFTYLFNYLGMHYDSRPSFECVEIALKVILAWTENNMKLSILTYQALLLGLSSSFPSLELLSFKILSAVTENGHLISREIVTTALDVIQNKTDLTFDECSTIVTLCISLLKRNQQIPSGFIDFACRQFTTTSVTGALENNQICWLLILVELAENHYVLPLDVVIRICGCFHELKSGPHRSKVLNALVRLVCHGSIYSICYVQFKTAFISTINNRNDSSNIIQSPLRDVETAICGLKLIYDLDASSVDGTDWKVVQEKCWNMELGNRAKTILEGSDLLSSQPSNRARCINQLNHCCHDMDFILILADTYLSSCWIYDQTFVIDRLEKILVSSDSSEGLIDRVLDLLGSFPKIPTKLFNALGFTLVNNACLYIIKHAALLMENTIIAKKIDIVSETLINMLPCVERGDCQNILRLLYENGLAPTSFQPSDQLKMEWKLYSMGFGRDKVKEISNFLQDPNLLDREPGNLGKLSKIVKDLLFLKAPSVTLKSIPRVGIYMSYLLLQQPRPRQTKNTLSKIVNFVIRNKSKEFKSLIGISPVSKDVSVMLEIVEDSLIQSQSALCDQVGNALRCSFNNCTHSILHRILYQAYDYALENFPLHFESPSKRTIEVFRTMILVLEFFQTNENSFKFCNSWIISTACILRCCTRVLKSSKIELRDLIPINDFRLVDIFEKCLQCSSARIRNLAFGNLKILQDLNRYSFDFMVQNFNKVTSYSFGDAKFEPGQCVSFKDFKIHLLETLFSTSNWDFSVFKNVKEIDWVRHLLIADCVSVYKTCNTKTKRSLHVMLINLFNKFDLTEVMEILHLILYSPFLVLQFVPVLDTIQIMEFACQLEFQDVIKILEGSHEYFSNCFDLNPSKQWRDFLHRSVLRKALKSKFWINIKISDEILSPLTDQLIQIAGLQNATTILNLLEESTFKTVSSFDDNLISILSRFPSQQSISSIVSKDPTAMLMPRSCTELAHLLKVEYLMTLWSSQYEGRNIVKQYFFKIIAHKLPFDKIIILVKLLLPLQSSDASSTSLSSRAIGENILGQICNYQVGALVFSEILYTCTTIMGHTQLCSSLPGGYIAGSGSGSGSGHAANTQKCLISAVNQIIMEHLFEGATGKKDIEVFLKDFRAHNINSLCDFDVCFETDFKSKIELISKGQTVSSILNIETHISDWNKEEILKWCGAQVQKFRQNVISPHEFNVEYLTVAKRAISLVRNYDLTYVQIISCLLAFKSDLHNSQAKQGQLQQIVTGCGKSTIVAIMAVFGALQGKKVDVYTSSPVLAERDAREWSNFYELFSLTSDHNGDRNQVYSLGPKKCYESDIVYGDTSQFQFDTLRHEYSGLGTRGGRAFQLALIDEVDCMLIDDSSKLARLSTTLPAMDCLQIMYHFIWERIRYLQQHLYSFSNQIYFVEGQVVGLDGSKVLYRFADLNQHEQIFEIPNFHRFLTFGNNFEKARIHRINNVDAFVLEHLVSYSQSLITPPEPLVKIPKNLFDFVKGQIPQWVESALSALVFQENVNYIVDEGQIKPVDYQTTGVIQSCTNWSNGLHQFLQIKHSLKIKSETVTTNFLSNIAMFEKYGPNIVGLTGTLGSEVSRQVLAESYGVTVYLIPENHFKKFHRLPDLIFNDVKEWRDKIVASASHESVKGRGVLIIAETISEAQLISELLLNTGILAKLYTRNNANQEKHVDRIHPHDVIVATNLAGRGTDIQASDINSNGGLHVILTFLPDSLRVEEQAFGRTSRQGHKGSGQLIAFCSSWPMNADTNSDQLLQERAHLEKMRLENFAGNDLLIIKTKDLLFGEFCQFYNQVRSALIQNRPKINIAKTAIVKRIDPNRAYRLNPIEQVILQSLEELWAMFLKKVDDGRIDIGAAAGWEFREFMAKAKEKCQLILSGQSNNTNSAGLVCLPCESAFYYCQLGNLEFRADSKINPRLEVAGKYFDKAIEFDSNFAAPAHVGKAYILLKGSDPILGKIKYAKNYKENAIELLTNGLALLSREMTTLTSMQSLLYHRNRYTPSLSECSDLYEQLLTKANLLGSYTNSVEANLKGVIKSLRRVYCEEVSETGNCIKEGYISDRLITVVTPNETQFYNLTFHDLTLHKDLVDSDQAIKTYESSKRIIAKWDYSCSKIYVECTSLESIAQLQIEQNLELYKTSNTKLHFEYSKLSLAEVEKILEQLIEYGFTDGYTTDLLTNLLPPRTCSFSSIFEIVKRLQADENHCKATSYKLILNGVRPVRLTNPIQDTSDKIDSKAWNEFISTFPLLKCTVRVSTHNFRELINLFRSLNLDFALYISNVLFGEAQEILENAAMDQEDIVLSETKELTDLQMSGYTPLIEILELKSRGILLIVTFNERKFIPWWTVTSVGLLAGTQMIIGTCLFCTGIGATIGIGLLTEGAVDMITAARITSTREFSWKQFAIQKSVSLVLSATTMGVQAFKAGSSGAGVGSTFLGGIINEGAEQAGTQMLVNTKNIFQTAKVGLQNFLKSSVGQALLITGEVGLRVGINTAIDILSKFSFDQIRSHLRKHVEFYWLQSFKRHLYPVFRRHYALDKLFRSKTLNEKVQHLLRRMTTGQFSDFTETWMKTTNVLCSAVQKLSKEASGYAIFFSSLVTYVSQLVDICTVIDKITEEMLRDLSSEADLHRSSAQFILLNACEVSHSKSISCARKIMFTKENNYDFEAEYFDKVGISNIVGPEKYENIRLCFDRLHTFEKEFEMERVEMLDLNCWVINEITSHIVGLADSELFNPVRRPQVGSFITHFYPDLETGEMILTYLDKGDTTIGSEGSNGNANGNTELGAGDGSVFYDISEDIAGNLNAGSVQAMSLDWDVNAFNATFLAEPSMLLGRIM